jgi:hypothetical protein
MLDSAHGEWKPFLRQRGRASVRAQILLLSNSLAAGFRDPDVAPKNDQPPIWRDCGATQFGLAAHEAAALSGSVMRFNLRVS